MALPGRVVATDIGAIVEVDLVTFPSLDPFIDVANELATEICVDRPAEASDPTPYTDHRLFLIEKYLAAHFYCVSDPRPSSERASVVSQSLQHKIGFGLKNTSFGQQAIRLDTKGNLASLDNVMEKIELPKGGVGALYLGTSCGRRRWAWDN